MDLRSDGTYRCELAGPRGLQVLQLGTYKFDGSNLVLKQTNASAMPKAGGKSVQTTEPVYLIEPAKLQGDTLTLTTRWEISEWHRGRT